MRILGVILGILISIMGGYAMMLDTELFLNIGWLLGVLIVVSGIMLLVPKFKEMAAAKKEKKETAELVSKKKDRKNKNQEKPVKKDNTNNVLGGISVALGMIIFLSGVTKTITELGVVYLMGACVLCFGLIQLSALTKKKDKQEPEKPSKKKKKKHQPEPEPEKKSNKTTIVCCVLSLVLGALAVYSSFITFMEVKELIAYNTVMQGVNVVLIMLNTYKKGERV